MGHALRFGGKALLGAAKKGLPMAGRAASKAGRFAIRRPGTTAGAALTGGFFASDLGKAFKRSAPMRGKVQLRNLASRIPVPR